ncbi:flagellar hook-length control protein FliK [Paenibacillus hamazuiensis]|uniref:flagellar hook-length control protein FliK n=1 Tax=Paenibacillus hamazuiensis TaxID=2936508 RepID=UPI00200E47D7|nr:flagellar hook-length control protein FliK [Paenibacillus hamazuiensis]
MDIQMQTSMPAAPTAVTGGGSAGGGKPAASAADIMNNGQNGGFLSALNALMAGNGDPQTALGNLSMPELIQLVSAILPNVKDVSADQQVSIPQMEAGIAKLLEALQGDQDQAEQLVSSDGMQQLLAQIQMFLLVLPQTPSAELPDQETLKDSEDAPTLVDPLQTGDLAVLPEPLDSDLFVPLHQQLPDAKSATDKTISGQAAGQKFQVQDAKELLTVLSAVLPFTADRAEVTQLSAELQKAVASIKNAGQDAKITEPSGVNGSSDNVKISADPTVSSAIAQAKPEVGKPVVTARGQSKHAAPVEALLSNDSENSDVVVENVVTAAVPKSKLELLAAKALLSNPMIKHVIAQGDDEPQSSSANEETVTSTPSVQVHDLLKTLNPKDNSVKLPAQPVPVQRFSEEMTQFVVKNLRVTLANGLSEAKISLAPEHLGHVDVKITVHNGQVVAQFMADTVAGKEMLESQLSQLRTNLQSQGIAVDKLEVSQSPNLQSGMFQDSRGQQSQQQSGRQSKGNKSGSGFEAAADEAVQSVTGSVSGTLDNGTIDVTA